MIKSLDLNVSLCQFVTLYCYLLSLSSTILLNTDKTVELIRFRLLF